MSCVIGNDGGSLKTDSMSQAASVMLPSGSVQKETKVGLQVGIVVQFDLLFYFQQSAWSSSGSVF